MYEHLNKNKYIYIVGIITTIIAYIYQVTIGTTLSISLENGSSGKVLIKNIGSNDIKISSVKAGEYKSNFIIFTQPQINNLSEYMQRQMKDSMNINNLLTIENIDGIVISPNNTIERKLISKPTQQGTFVAFDIPFKINYESTSTWINIFLSLFKNIDLIDQKKYIYIRFDGCEFSEIGENAYTNREDHKKEITEKLQYCLKKDIKFYTLQQLIIKGSNQNSIQIKRELQKLSDLKLITLSKKLIQKISNLKDGSKMNYCYETSFYLDELKERNILDNILKTKFVNSCTLYM